MIRESKSVPIRSLAQLREAAAAAPRRRVAVAWATGGATLEASALARETGFADPVLVGPEPEIRSSLQQLGFDSAEFEIHASPDPASAAATCVSLIRSGEAGILLKGALPTAELMRAVLDQKTGLRASRLLSDVFLFDFLRGAASRIVGITDGGVVPRPDFEQKERILRNAVEAFHALGVNRPAVAVLAAVETVTEAFPSTRDAARLAALVSDHADSGCEVDGPLAVDLALSSEAAAMKGVDSPIAGKADILLFPDLESANMSAKSVEYVAGLEPAHCVVGARVPVLIPSRSESAGARLSSIAFGALLAGQSGC
ncbi:MAG: phosphate acyltransferase [marine benthic group bacterium]|nr:phosphate acyltransferase [Gemmatimonadota bacterium]